MHVSIVGSGYVGTTIAACLADFGHDVTNVEIDEGIVETINAGESPIHEPGLAERIAEHAGENLRATTDYGAVRETDVTFLCLPTPQQDDGSLDLGAMRAASASLGDALAEKEGDHLVVVKSTVLPGTTEDVVGPIVSDHAGRAIGDGIELAMNPEFLRMGTAVQDFLEPEKIVVGATDPAAADTLRDLYAPMLEQGATFVETGLREAELIKYANNAFLASKVSLVNELGNIAKEYDVDAYEVLEAVGLDDRISARFMRSDLAGVAPVSQRTSTRFGPVRASRATNLRCSTPSSRSTTPSRDDWSTCSRPTSISRERVLPSSASRSSRTPTTSANPGPST